MNGETFRKIEPVLKELLSKMLDGKEWGINIENDIKKYFPQLAEFMIDKMKTAK